MTIRIWLIALLTLMASYICGQAGVVKNVNVEGNQHVSTAAILATMRTKVGQPFVQATLDADKTLVDGMGFFSAVDPRAKLNDDGSYDVTISVQEFPIVKEIRVSGNQAIPTDQIMKAIQVKVGEVYNLRAVQPSTDKIRELYTKKGLFAEVSDFAPLPESPGTVNVEVIELKVGKVDISGATKTRPRVFHHLIRTRPGEPFSQQKWTDDIRRIYATQWFDPDSIKPSATEPKAGEIDLGVALKEQRTGNIGFGLQADQENTIAGFFRLSESNFRGTGQSVGVDLLQSTGGGGPSLTLNYSNPFTDNHDTALNFSVYSRIIYRFAGTAFGSNTTPTNSDRYYERRTGFTVGLTRPDYSQKTVFGVSGRFESVQTNNLSDTSTANFIRQDGNTAALTFGLTRNRRDYDLDPARGDWSQFTVTPGVSQITDIGGQASDRTLLGTNFFNKLNLEYRFYWSPQKARPVDKLDDPRKVFAFRARYGYIMGTIPFFEQYFVGGVDTLRGYQDDRFWGRNQLLFNTEFRFPVQKSFNLLWFVDYGGAWGGYATVNSFSQSANLRMHLGFGPGVSFRTPLGPIRLDLGFTDRGKSRLDFQIGTSF